MIDVTTKQLTSLRKITRKIAKSFSEDDEYQGEAELALVEAMNSFDLNKNVPLENWVGLCVRRHLINFEKKWERDAIKFSTDAAGELATVPQADMVSVVDAINDLPQPLKCIATKKWLQGKTYKQIEHETGITVRKVTECLKEQCIPRIRDYLESRGVVVPTELELEPE